MSGGHFDYIQHRFNDAADEVKRLIDYNTDSDEYGYSRDYPQKIIDKFREAEKTIRTAGKMLQRIDWLVSGDDGMDDFIERWKEDGL